MNALPVQGWFDLADALDQASRDMNTHVVVLRAEGKGFNAGVDIKEMQQTEGFDALIGANRGCFAAFRAVYECAVPVVAAVQGFCVGGGVGLVGNADCIVASEDAYFGIPEVDRGALGAATHLSRMVPPHLMRTLYFTGRNIAATDLVQHGSVLEVVPRDQLDDAALAVAAEIARKDTRVIRMAKEAINGIDPVDVNRSYRFEQGFTMELNLAGVADEHRDAFARDEQVRLDRRGEQAVSMPSKVMSVEDVVGRIDDGMTVGIGGWGSRRKPMALVRAILRSDLKDLTIVSYAGPDVGLLLQAGKASRVVFAFATLDSIPLEPLFSRARQEATASFREWDEGMFQTGLRAAAQRLPFLPMRAGLGSAVLENDPTLRTVISPYDGPDGPEELVAVPALELDVALVHMNRADQFGNAQYLGPDPYFDDLFCMAAKEAYVSTEQIIDTAGMTVDAAIQTMLLNRTMVAGVVETPNGAHFTTCTPTYERDEAFQKAYATAAKTPEDWSVFEQRFLSGSEQDYQDAVAAFAEESDLGRGHERRDPRGVLRRRHRRLLRRRRRGDGQPDGAAAEPGRAAGQAHLEPAADDHRRRGPHPAGRPSAGRHPGRRRGLDAVPPRPGVGRVLRQAPRDDGRHPDRPGGQPEHLGDRRLGAAEAAAARCPRRTRQHRQQQDLLLGAQALRARLRRPRRRRLAASGARAPRLPVPLPLASTRCTAWSATSVSSTSRVPATRCGSSRCTPESPSRRCRRLRRSRSTA